MYLIFSNTEHLSFNTVRLFIQYWTVLMASCQLDYYDPSEVHIYVI
jgi:hypothetical protein